MSKIKTSLRRLLGRIREYMEQIYIMAATISIPLGFTVLFIGANEKDISLKIAGVSFIVLGIVFWILATKATRIRERIEKAKFEVQIQELRTIRNGITTVITELITEIREDRNERNNQPKQ